MLDWLTLKIDVSKLDSVTFERLKQSQSVICCINPDGVIEWERKARDSVRSDSHKIQLEMGSDLMIYGSPARVGLKRLDNVFGSGDPIECATRMIEFVERIREVKLPDFREWKCTRMDVTQNYNMGDLVNVLTALEMLRHAEGGRYQVRTSAESVYWSQNSTFRKGKAYSKGAHMRYLAKRGRAFLDDFEIRACEKLLRLELTLARHFFSKTLKGRNWFDLSETELNEEHEKYFCELVGKVEVSEMTDMRKACIQAALRLGLSVGQGKAAYLSWNTIRAVGFAVWKSESARATFYRHKKILREAGLSYADFQARNIVPIRRRRVVLDQPVNSWAELLKAA